MATPGDRDETELLLEFLQARDFACPACGYNLRDLTAPTCPECRKELTLAVGFNRPQVLWFVVMIAPSVFSGIAAALLLVPLAGALLTGNRQPWPLCAIDAFGWISGLAALLLLRHRYAILRLSDRVQRTWAITAWLVHIFAFAVAILLVVAFS